MIGSEHTNNEGGAQLAA